MIRIYQEGDHNDIAEIFPRAVHEIASTYYSIAQCSAWSGKRPNPAHWKMRCRLKRPFVYVEGGKVAGFLELDPDGHIDCAYVHPKHARRGIATALVQYAIAICRDCGLPELNVEASLCAKPLFEKIGFATLKEQTVYIDGVGLTNFKMAYSM